MVGWPSGAFISAGGDAMEILAINQRLRFRLRLIFLALMASGSLANSQVPPSQREALINLFNSTNGTGWTQNYNWCDGTCPVAGSVTFNAPGTECTWVGVGCDSGSTTVTAVGLYSNHLVGTIPDLSALKNLQYVGFYD